MMMMMKKGEDSVAQSQAADTALHLQKSGEIKEKIKKRKKKKEKRKKKKEKEERIMKEPLTWRLLKIFLLNLSSIASYFPKASASFLENFPISSRFFCASFPSSRYPDPSISGVKEEYPRKYTFSPNLSLNSNSRITAGRNKLSTYEARENLKPTGNQSNKKEERKEKGKKDIQSRNQRGNLKNENKLVFFSFFSSTWNQFFSDSCSSNHRSPLNHTHLKTGLG